MVLLTDQLVSTQSFKSKVLHMWGGSEVTCLYNRLLQHVHTCATDVASASYTPLLESLKAFPLHYVYLFPL